METTGLAEAVKAIQRMAQEAAFVRVEKLPCDDGAGGALEVPVAFVQDGENVVPHSLASLMAEGSELAQRLRLAKAPGPDFRQGVAVHQSLASFVAHANRFKDEGSAVWADAASRRLVSVLDYHPTGAASAARWGRHRGVYACPLSGAWQAWGGLEGLELEQEDFAALLDSRDRELAVGKLPSGKPAPDPSALVTLANSLEVYSHATARRERDANTGRLTVSFVEEKGVVGSVAPPPAFLVSVRVFEDGQPQLLEVRLRVTVKEGKAFFALNLHAAAEVLRQAFEGVCGQVAAGTTLPVFVGTPE